LRKKCSRRCKRRAARQVRVCRKNGHEHDDRFSEGIRDRKGKMRRTRRSERSDPEGYRPERKEVWEVKN